MKNQYYQESGKISIIRFTLTTIFGVTLALLLGYFYSIINYIIPFAFLRLFITIGLGIALGFIVKLIVRFSHNRNRKSQIIQAVSIGLIAYYSQWVTFLVILANDSIPSIMECAYNLPWMFVMPLDFFSFIGEINRSGLWYISDILINGFAYTAFWILESIIIIFIPILAAIKTKIYPYSEMNSRWYLEYTLEHDFASLATMKKTISQLTESPLEAIQDMGKGNGTRFSKVHIFYFENETQQYVTIDRTFIANKGNGKKKTEILINNFAISKSAADAIMSKFINRRERVSVF